MKNKIILVLTSLLVPLFGMAQDVATTPDMADTFRSSGKIYVVIAVISIIFICLMAYLIHIDLKLKKLENKK